MSSSENRLRIVVDDAVPHAETLFGDLGAVLRLPGRQIDRHAVRDADALIVRSRTRVNADLLAGSRVRFVGSTVVGLDHVDQNWLRHAGIAFYSAQGCNANAVAEYVIANLLRWAVEKGQPLAGKTLAIVGVGHVGRRVQIKAEALGLKCLLNDPPRAAREADFPHTPLAACLRQADFITLHTPLTDTGPHPTRHLLNHDNMRLIQPHAVLINAARGGIVEESAWLETETAADIIDCWTNEPNIDSRLFQRAWLATPHIAGHSLDAKLAGGLMVSTALRRHWRLPPLPVHAERLLPPPPAIRTPNSSDPLAFINELLCQIYDFRQDHDTLRRADNLPERFERHRRDYPPRREWHAVPLPSTDPKIRSLLHRIGFAPTQQHFSVSEF